LPAAERVFDSTVDHVRERLKMTQPSELADVVQRLYEAFATGDVDAIERMTSDDEGAVAVGTDPDERWEGGSEIKAQLREQFAGGQMRVKPGNPRIDQAGDVGWFADRPAFVTPDGHDIPFRCHRRVATRGRRMEADPKPRLHRRPERTGVRTVTDSACTSS
jgi:hypothetical protein